MKTSFGCGFCLGVNLVDLFAVTFFDYSTSQLQRGREGAVFRGEFVGDEHHTLQLFETREFLIYLFGNAFV